MKFGDITRVLFFGVGVEIGANRIVFGYDGPRGRQMLRSFETHMLNEMRNAAQIGRLEGGPYPTKHIDVGYIHMIFGRFINHTEPIRKCMGLYLCCWHSGLLQYTTVIIINQSIFTDAKPFIVVQRQFREGHGRYRAQWCSVPRVRPPSWG